MRVFSMEASDHKGKTSPTRKIYVTPPPTRRERLWRFVRRLMFPFVAVLFVGGIAGLFYWNSDLWQAEQVRSAVDALGTYVDDRVEGAAPDTAGRSHVSIRTVPDGATIRLNSDSVGTTPYTDSSIRAGLYVLSVRARDHSPLDTLIDLRENTRTALEFSLRVRPGYERSGSEASSSPPQRAVSRQSDGRAVRPPAVEAEPPNTTARPTSPTRSLGALYVTSAPSGALVSIGEETWGPTPVGIADVPLGSTVLEVSLDGYESWNTQIEVQGEVPHRVHAELQPRPGHLRILARPWGTIYVNGTLQVQDSDVWYGLPLSSGTHEVKVVHPVLGEETRQVVVHPEEQTSVIIDLQAQEEPPSP